MEKYAILYNPGHNRVYFKAAQALSATELELAAKKLKAVPENISGETLGGLPYLLFETAIPLFPEDLALISRLSFVYGIYELKGEALIPLDKAANHYFESEDITTILKYNGKTNELFTRLALNAAIFSSAFNIGDELNILDPLCGKGTTMFEALLNGYNAYGVETEERVLHEGTVFFKKYLENLRYKHSMHQEKQGMNRYTAKKTKIKIGRGKNDISKEAIFVSGDTRDTAAFFKKNSMHIIVGDLPYGVQHGSKKDNRGKSRNALPLITEALPAWYSVLKPGGALALAYNLFLIRREEMEQALSNAGFTLTNHSFVHRVDQAINRDLIIGIKP